VTDRASAINSPVNKTTSTAEASASQKPSSVFLRAVVVEMLNDPSYYSDEELLEIFNNISNPGILTGNPVVPPFDEEAGDTVETLRYLIPRNSLLIKIVTAGAAKSEPKSTLCFPFFPPHLQLPVKPGEQVWVMSERPGQEMKYLYWMFRITAPGFTDGINYTHLDRQILPAPTDVTASFPNGDGTPPHFTLPEPDSYDVIVDESSAEISFSPEPVPRLTRRIGDLVLQGSNNTLILLSDDRGWGADELPATSETSNASKSVDEVLRTFAGSIDVVAGRGRFLGAVDADPVGTPPRVIENAREKEETDKYFINPIEGDPDFVTDSSRVYVAMNTDGDLKLGLTYPTVDLVPVLPVIASPYVIVKSDEVRIVARQDTVNAINGSIKIVKEGIENVDKAVIIMQPDGSIMIDGPKIVLGSGLPDQVIIGNDLLGSDHLIKGETLLAMIKALETTFNNHIHNTGVGPSAPPTPPLSTELWDLSLSIVGKVK